MSLMPLLKESLFLYSQTSFHHRCEQTTTYLWSYRRLKINCQNQQTLSTICVVTEIQIYFPAKKYFVLVTLFCLQEIRLHILYFFLLLVDILIYILFYFLVVVFLSYYFNLLNICFVYKI